MTLRLFSSHPSDVNDKVAEIEALLQLGALLKKCHRYDEAHGFYQHARELAAGEEEIGTLKRINCIIGVVLGEQQMEDYFNNLLVKAKGSF